MNSLPVLPAFHHNALKADNDGTVPFQSIESRFASALTKPGNQVFKKNSSKQNLEDLKFLNKNHIRAMFNPDSYESAKYSSNNKKSKDKLLVRKASLYDEFKLKVIVDEKPRQSSYEGISQRVRVFTNNSFDKNKKLNDLETPEPQKPPQFIVKVASQVNAKNDSTKPVNKIQMMSNKRFSVVQPLDTIPEKETRPKRKSDIIPPNYWSVRENPNENKNNNQMSKKQLKLRKEYEQVIETRIEESTIAESDKGKQKDMFERNLEWKRKKEERLEQIRKGKARQELDNCTFKPNIRKLNVSKI